MYSMCQSFVSTVHPRSVFCPPTCPRNAVPVLWFCFLLFFIAGDYRMSTGSGLRAGVFTFQVSLQGGDFCMSLKFPAISRTMKTNDRCTTCQIHFGVKRLRTSLPQKTKCNKNCSMSSALYFSKCCKVNCIFFT